jgi:hypothetical protein
MMSDAAIHAVYFIHVYLNVTAHYAPILYYLLVFNDCYSIFLYRCQTFY